ncbi:hypothetical protein [Segeticoccus rhizosphaerae]|uniref:hypothetical protein n=1 Tax=Segeticoccus rhizosphaerae TaxID=1104777 RepID=UPI001265A408|nr:hypothetical protein [Segeticoccus rhizosphaerae]
MTTELVGPLDVVVFGGGGYDHALSFGENMARRPKVAYTPPANTLDPRYQACTDHHVACDCREAEFAEDRQERRQNDAMVRQVVDSVLLGHPTYGDGDSEGCMCTGCQIVRRAALPRRLA